MLAVTQNPRISVLSDKSVTNFETCRLSICTAFFSGLLFSGVKIMVNMFLDSIWFYYWYRSMHYMESNFYGFSVTQLSWFKIMLHTVSKHLSFMRIYGKSTFWLSKPLCIFLLQNTPWYLTDTQNPFSMVLCDEIKVLRKCTTMCYAVWRNIFFVIFSLQLMK